MRKKLFFIAFGILTFFLIQPYLTSAQTPGESQNTARIQGRKVGIETAPSTITIKETGQTGPTIATYTIKTSSPSATIDGATVTNDFTTGNILPMGKEYVLSINELPGYKAMYSVNRNSIIHDEDSYKLGNTVTVTIPSELPKNPDGTDYPNAYLDIYWKYIPIPTVDPQCPKKPLGDANCDQAIDMKDYAIWKCEFLGNNVCSASDLLPPGTISSSGWANFNFQSFDASVNLVDFEIWRKNTAANGATVSSSPTAVVTSAVVTNTPTPTKIPSPTPTPGYQSRILFTSNRYGNNDIFVKELNGEEKRLTTSNANDYEPKISRDGRQIVFTSYRDLNNEIYIMNADGTNQRNLTNNSNSDINPVLSPDGSRIAFSSNRNREGNYDLYIMDTDGKNITRLTNKPLDDTQPSFSPGGTKIAFTSYRDGQAEIYTLDLTKPNIDLNLAYDLQRWTNSPAIDFQPSFDPISNDRIVFTSSRPGYYRVYSMVMVKTAEKPFPDVVRLNSINGNYNDWEPSYSSNAQRIVFTSQRQRNYEIWAMNADGSNQDRITDNTDNDSTPVFFP